MSQTYYVLMAALFLVACGDDSDSTESGGVNPAVTSSLAPAGTTLTPIGDEGTDGTPASTRPGNAESDGMANGLTAPSLPDAGVGTECAANAPGEICVLVQVPAELPSLPEKVSIHFFTVIPPIGPPNVMGAEIGDAEQLSRFVPGTTVPLVMSGLPSEGEMFLYGALYMPGGGAQSWQSVPNIDFHGAYDWYEAIQFTGEPQNLPRPLTFTVFSN